MKMLIKTFLTVFISSIVFLVLSKREKILLYTCINLKFRYFTTGLFFFLFNGLNVFLYVVPDEELMIEHEDSVSKTKMQVEKQKTSRKGRFTSKYFKKLYILF